MFEKICVKAFDWSNDVFLSRFILEVMEFEVPEEVNVFDKFILSVDFKLNSLKIFAWTNGKSDKILVFFKLIKILSEIFLYSIHFL